MPSDTTISFVEGTRRGGFAMQLIRGTGWARWLACMGTVLIERYWPIVAVGGTAVGGSEIAPGVVTWLACLELIGDEGLKRSSVTAIPIQMIAVIKLPAGLRFFAPPAMLRLHSSPKEQATFSLHATPVILRPE